MKGMKPVLRYTIIAALIVVLFFSPTAAAAPDSGQTAFMTAEKAYTALFGNAERQKYRDNWLECIEKYRNVLNAAQDSRMIATALYKTGLLYKGLYRYSRLQTDIKEAQGAFERLIRQYPDSKYRSKAMEEMKKISPETAVQAQATQVPYHKKSNAALKKKPQNPASPAQSEEAQTAENQPSVPTGPTIVTDFRFWSNPNYTRVVIDTDKETTFSHQLLDKNISLKKPKRLFIDLDQSKLSKQLSKLVPIDDNLLENIRAAQNTLDTVRVVIDIKSFDNYKVFSLKNPFRIVIDVWGKGGAALARSTPPPPPPAAASSSSPPAHPPSTASAPAPVASEPPALPAKADEKPVVGAIAKQLALGVRRIVIDPGHGGKDHGAPGCVDGVSEKDIVLQLAKKLAARIRAELNCEVILTRNKDTFLTLEERTAIANTQNADLFISLHTNASKDQRAYGIETYFLNLATDDDAIRVAAAENATSTKNISDLQSILLDLMQNAKINESTRLATRVQEYMYTGLRNNYGKTKNKGVKQAPFYVLLGAQMPAILIETGFVSHPRECKFLIDPRYQDRLSDSIVGGIRHYIRETNPTAFMDKKPGGRSKG